MNFYIPQSLLENSLRILEKNDFWNTNKSFLKIVSTDSKQIINLVTETKMLGLIRTEPLTRYYLA
jgi:hypothetical protein